MLTSTHDWYESAGIQQYIGSLEFCDTTARRCIRKDEIRTNTDCRMLCRLGIKIV